MWLELWVIFACGAGTFLLRFLPIWRVLRQKPGSSPQAPQDHNRIQRFFAGVGPAALTALLLVSIWPFFRHASDAPRILAAALALVVLLAVKRWRRGIAAPTLAGAIVYGVLMHILTTA